MKENTVNDNEKDCSIRNPGIDKMINPNIK